MQPTDYIGEQLYIAVKILATGEDDLRSRLELVYEKCFFPILPPAYRVPEGLKGRFESIRERLKPESLATLDDSECSGLAEEILSLGEDYRRHQR